MPQQSWFIAIEIPEPVKTEIEAIKQRISSAYGTYSVLKSPAHITIVPPFYWGNGLALLNSIHNFAFNSFIITLKGFQKFESKVVYIGVQDHSELISLYTHFNQYFFDLFPPLKRKPTFPFHPHVTVGNRDWKQEQFKKCCDEYLVKDFTGSVICNKLTLYELKSGKWSAFTGE